jgi:hypothetical protein
VNIRNLHTRRADFNAVRPSPRGAKKSACITWRPYVCSSIGWSRGKSYRPILPIPSGDRSIASRRVILSRARDGVPQKAWFPCISVKRGDCLGSCSSGGRCGQE